MPVPNKWMILTIVAEIMTTRIPARSRRQAMDWSLVLVSQGIETTIDLDADLGWGLIVTESDHARSIDVLKRYLAENRQWPQRAFLARMLAAGDSATVLARHFDPSSKPALSKKEGLSFKRVARIEVPLSTTCLF